MSRFTDDEGDENWDRIADSERQTLRFTPPNPDAAPPGVAEDIKAAAAYLRLPFYRRWFTPRPSGFRVEGDGPLWS